MTEAHLRFVTRLSNATLESLLTELPKEDQLEWGDRSQVVELVRKGKRYVIAGGIWRQGRDEQRRSLRMAKAAAALSKLAAVKRRKVDAQKLASQAGRLLERLKAHKYFTYRVVERSRCAGWTVSRLGAIAWSSSCSMAAACGSAN